MIHIRLIFSTICPGNILSRDVKQETNFLRYLFRGVAVSEWNGKEGKILD